MSDETHEHVDQAPSGGKGAFVLKWLILGIGLLIIVVSWAVQRSSAPQPTQPSNTPASSQAAARDPRKHTCITPCTIDIYWPNRIEGPGVEINVNAPIEGGERRDFIIARDGTMTSKDGKEYKIWRGPWEFSTATPGLLITVFNEEK